MIDPTPTIHEVTILSVSTRPTLSARPAAGVTVHFRTADGTMGWDNFAAVQDDDSAAVVRVKEAKVRRFQQARASDKTYAIIEPHIPGTRSHEGTRVMWLVPDEAAELRAAKDAEGPPPRCLIPRTVVWEPHLVNLCCLVDEVREVQGEVDASPTVKSLCKRLNDIFAETPILTELVKTGLAARTAHGLVLTDAGRAALEANR